MFLGAGTRPIGPDRHNSSSFWNVFFAVLVPARDSLVVNPLRRTFVMRFYVVTNVPGTVSFCSHIVTSRRKITITTALLSRLPTTQNFVSH